MHEEKRDKEEAEEKEEGEEKVDVDKGSRPAP